MEQSKNSTIIKLRREVGFGCPICRSPFLTWHHFDPPRHIEEHWRPEGMIALCLLCHDDADEKGQHAGAYSKEKLRAMKNTPRSSDDVKGHFPSWGEKEKLLVRMGGCYMDSGSPLFSINKIPQITVAKNEAGIMCLSLVLRNIRDDIVLEMKENWLTAYPTNIHDMIITPKTKEVKVWLTKDDVGLNMKFKRITIKELDSYLSQDHTRAIGKLDEILEMGPTHLYSELQSRIMQEAKSKDETGDSIKKWVLEYCQDSDGLVPFMDIEQMAINYRGKKFIIHNGIADFLYYSAAFGNRAGAININI